MKSKYSVILTLTPFFPGIFPEADKDPVIQIASMVQRQGETEPFIRTVFTLQSCASIVGSQILCFTQEKQLLQVCTQASVKHCKNKNIVTCFPHSLFYVFVDHLFMCLWAELGRVFEDCGPRHHYWIQHPELWLSLLAQQSSCFKG